MKDYMNKLYAIYQEVQAMSEEDILKEYGDCKADVIRDIENEIDGYEKEVEAGNMVFGLDPAFSSFESVNSMFV
jgi:hypothetical protein